MKAEEFDVAAKGLQREVTEQEKINLDNGLDQYSEEYVRQAIVHTRADVVLMCSYSRWSVAYLKKIEKVLWVIAGILAVIGIKYLFS